MSSSQTYRERGDRDRASRSSEYSGRGGGRGRGTGYKPRRYWDNDEYYKEDRDRGGRRRRRSYSRSRSRSRSYSSGSRSRSRTPPPKRGRSRSRSPPKVEEYVPRTAAELSGGGSGLVGTEAYVPSKTSSGGWSTSAPEYVPQANGQAMLNQMNPYGAMDPAIMYGSQYMPGQMSMPINAQGAVPYGYGQPPSMSLSSGYQNPVPDSGYPAPVQVHQVTNIPTSFNDTKLIKDDANDSKKKKEKRKKKKRHHSSSSSSTSSENSSGESRKHRKSKKDRGSSNSSSDDEKKDSSRTPQTGGLTAQQKESLIKQREGYQAKLEILEREIHKLRNKEDELIHNRADRHLIDENLKLQAELKGRCKAVLIVLEKIDDVLQVGNKSAVDRPKAAVPPPPTLTAAIPPPAKISQSQAMPDVKVKSTKDVDKSGVSAFDYFDNGEHWCRLCNVFPVTVEQMLSHFHSKEHHDQIQQLGIDEKPWHKRKSITDSKSVPGARKAPMRGMQFFSPVEGWYCRLCNHWMGDPHCAVEHLKSDEHNSNYMNFLEEHPDWEMKWVSDREKAFGVSGKAFAHDGSSRSKYHEDNQRPPEKSKEDLESVKSIRVQMRNVLKTEASNENSKFTAPIAEPSNKDLSLDEWMTKPKVTMDLIDTQKFAAIVRQKHGTKEKEFKEKDSKSNPVVEVKAPPAPPVISSQKERERDSRRDDRRRTEKVELQISSREKERDRYRERDRDSRSSRRRSHSRSRSRSRDRRYNRRRSRSRSRSRDRSDRDRRDKGGNRDRHESKEVVSKKLPMIGKMPLYKRPALAKEKPDSDDGKPAATTPDVAPVAPVPPANFSANESSLKEDSSRLPVIPDNSSSNMASMYMYDAHAASTYEHYVIPGVPTTTYVAPDAHHHPPQVSSGDYQHSVEMTDDIPGVDTKEAKDDAPAALPDDFQQALDIIYAAPGSKPASVPQPVPPPNGGTGATNGMVDEAMISEYGSTNEYGTMSSNGYGSYMGYQPYQQSFDGYAPYEDLDDGPPGVGNDPINSSSAVRPPPPLTTEAKQAESHEEKDPPPPGDDDMDDLRMLGIDVDDTAASGVRH